MLLREALCVARETSQKQLPGRCMLSDPGVKPQRTTSQKAVGDRCQQKGDNRVTFGSSGDAADPADPAVHIKKKDHQKDRAVEQGSE